MGVVNLLRKEGGHFQPDLGGQYHRILHLLLVIIKKFKVSLMLQPCVKRNNICL